jgi:sensor histidine kinase regulating citrate/malate metabolism
MPSMGWTEMVFLSVINLVGIVFTYMVTGLSMVKLENDIFLLFENRRAMLWEVPLMVCLLLAGELSLLAVWKSYRRILVEWQKNSVKQEQLKQMKQRFEEVSAFYGDIRKMRHEMRNHMSNIKGLLALGNYGEADSYLEKMDVAIRGVDFRYATASPVCDVILNDKAGAAERLHIPLDVQFFYRETATISVFDLGIILSNLLDNAIEACEKVPEADRFIRLELNTKGDFLLLKVENSYDGRLVWDDEKKLPVSTKENGSPKEILPEHGLGLKNVAELTEKYLGGMKLEEGRDPENHGIFRIIVMLQQ